ncbi:hypothetical protein RCL1_004147 [Eukaryota sp. TZLM3-RCL]
MGFPAHRPSDYRNLPAIPYNQRPRQVQPSPRGPIPRRPTSQLRKDWEIKPDLPAQHLSSRTASVPTLDQSAASRRERHRELVFSQSHEDSKRWEENRLLTSGLARVRKHTHTTDELDEDSDARVVLSVHNTVPPFLDGRIVFSRQHEEILVVKDPTSDIARLARKGSSTLMEVREQKTRIRAAKRVLGVSHVVDEEEIVPQNFGVSNYLEVLQQLESKPQSEFASTLTLSEQRSKLPITACRQGLLTLCRENQVVVVLGETGSGKTTQLPQFFLEEGFGSGDFIIGCTQPRRMAAVSVARRVAEERKTPLGKEVGYAIRFEDATSVDTKIKFMTDGILLRESLSDPALSNYSVIIMDEAHERSLNTDVLFGLLKRVLSLRLDLRVIITSATLDADRFSAFFGNAPIYKVPGRTFPVEVLHTKAMVDDYVEAAVKQTFAIHASSPPGDILVFATGQEDIDAICFLLREKIDESKKVKPAIILPLYSQLSADLQSRIFEPSRDGERKIVVSTNIAETSLTVDGVKYVVDCGYYKCKVYNPSIGMDSLFITPISRAQADQRSGRAGRTGPGQCYRLYTERCFKEDMLNSAVPEIQRTNLANVILLLKSLGINDLVSFDFLDPPPLQTLLNSMFQLWLLGALDNGGRLTNLGRKLAEFPLDPTLSKMIVSSVDFECSDEVISIVSTLSVPTIFNRPKNEEEQADNAHEKFMVPESDHLTLLNVYLSYERHNRDHRWAMKNYLHPKSLTKILDIRNQLLEIVSSPTVNIPIMSCKNSPNFSINIRKAITAAYFHNSAKMKSIGVYTNLRSAISLHLHPSSALYGNSHSADYVVYHDSVVTTKEYMQCVTVVEPEWLAELGPIFFSIRKSLEDIHREHEIVKEIKESGEEIMQESRRESVSSVIRPGSFQNFGSNFSVSREVAATPNRRRNRH